MRVPVLLELPEESFQVNRADLEKERETLEDLDNLVSRHLVIQIKQESRLFNSLRQLCCEELWTLLHHLDCFSFGQTQFTNVSKRRAQLSS